ncbi:hypothetical protein 2 [Beihai picorna-like virus 101]|uniref:hypothetical protein 2 n=1 Tax=Beihai picorna-like virus 101 TaxID=1922529 RepID=UPI00090A908A|nr:hypothetical protein 2 [Beihai picorna-like virus 101]APG76723.1 hypothetical protein 2 [Beihai picorna-like virus 101]
MVWLGCVMYLTATEKDKIFENDTHDNILQLTKFSDDTGYCDHKRESVMPNLNPFADVSLTGFLSRPYEIGTRTWSTSEARWIVLDSFSFPYVLFSQQPLFSKLKNFSFFSARIRFCVRINSTRMHAGKLLVAWYPFLDNVGDNRNVMNIVSASAFPNIIIDANTASTCDFVVPWDFPKQFLDMSDLKNNYHRNNMGRFVVFVLNPLVVPDNTPVQVSYWASFEDVKLAGYTSFEGELPSPPTALVNGDSPLNNDTLLDYLALSNEVHTQGDDHEQIEKSETRLVSGPAELVATISSLMSNIPLIGPIAKAVSTGALAVGGVAKAFGKSKPADLGAISRMQIAFPTLSHGTGLESAPVLGCLPENAITTLPKVDVVDQDEMQLSRLLSTEAYVGNWAITPTITPNSVIFERHNSPMAVLTHGVANNQYRVFHTPLSFTTSAFRFWRGSIRYRLQFVMSGFQSIRFQLLYEPSNAVGAIHASGPNVISTIIDVNQTTDFTFTVPYISDEPYKTVGGDPTTINSAFAGRIVLRTVTGLTNFTTPAVGMAINLFHSAGPDFQLFQPITNYLVDRSGVTRTELLDLDEEDQESYDFVETQGVMTSEEKRLDDYPPLLDATGIVLNNPVHGENITHLKQVLCRTSEVNKIINTQVCTVINPMSKKTYLRYTFMNWFGLIYRWWRGSFGVRALQYGAVLANAQSNIFINYVSKNLPSVEFTTGGVTALVVPPLGNGANFVPNDKNFIPQAIVPYYSNWFKQPTAWFQAPNTGFVNNMFIFNANNAQFGVFAGDDFELSRMIGPPNVLVEKDDFLPYN